MVLNVLFGEGLEILKFDVDVIDGACSLEKDLVLEVPTMNVRKVLFVRNLVLSEGLALESAIW